MKVRRTDRSTVHIADVVDLYLLALEKAPPRTFASWKAGNQRSGIWRRPSPTRWNWATRLP
jgi:hypothetical protein